MLQNQARAKSEEMIKHAKTNYTYIRHKDSLNNDEFTVTGWMQPDGPVIKNVAKFDGTNYLTIPHTPQLNTPRFTVAVWVYLSNNSGTQVIVDSLKIPGSPQTYYGYDIFQRNGIL